MNELPSSWTRVLLSSVAEVRLGRQRSPKRATGPNMRSYLRAANVTWNGIDVTDVNEMDFTDKEMETYRLQVGDILLSEASGSASEVGKPAVFRGEVAECGFQNTLIRVRAPVHLVPFLHLHFLKDALTGRFAEASRGVGIHHLGAEKMSAWEVVLPPLDEQHRIVAAIETHFSRLDAAVASLTRAKANVKRARASVLKAAVEGRLVPTEAALARAEGRRYEPASVLLDRILAERKAAWAASGARGKYQEPVEPDTDGLSALPEGWCWTSVDAVYENRDSERRPIKRDLREPGPIPYLGASGQIGTINGYTHDGRFLLVGEDGANLLARSKPIAFQMKGRAWVNNHAHVLRPFAGVPLGWGEAHFNAIDLSRYVTGSAQPKLPQGAMNKIAVPLPPLAEQHRIVVEVDRRLSVLDALDTSLDANLARCARLRQAILKRAFEGRLVPAEAPADAPLLAAEPPPPHYALDPRS